jgi:hypothetical protein
MWPDEWMVTNSFQKHRNWCFKFCKHFHNTSYLLLNYYPISFQKLMCGCGVLLVLHSHFIYIYIYIYIHIYIPWVSICSQTGLGLMIHLPLPRAGIIGIYHHYTQLTIMIVISWDLSFVLENYCYPWYIRKHKRLFIS